MNSTEIRKIILQIARQTGTSHIGSSLSCVEILNAIYSITDLDKIKNQSPDRYRIILSKGHAALALYSTMFVYGLMEENFISNYYTEGSFYSGHSNHKIKNIEFSTGALGHGFSVATGTAIGLKAKKIDTKVFCIVGDGEMNEGSNWEALMYSGNRQLNNLCLIIDNNQLSGVGDTHNSCSLEPLDQKLKAFKFNVASVDGHNENEIISAIQGDNYPLAIICNTVKGKGISFMENNNVWHYRPLSEIDYEKSVKELDNQGGGSI